MKPWSIAATLAARGAKIGAFLELFLKEGARRFVFEGRECGGHVGPRASFALWESQIEILLGFDKPEELAVLFAGGDVHGGAVIGSSDRQGAYPASDPQTPENFAATLYQALGISRQAQG